MPVPAYSFLLLSGAIFTLGAIGFMVRRNPLPSTWPSRR